MHKPELLTQAEQDEIENGPYGDYDEWNWYGYCTIDREIETDIDRMWQKEFRAARQTLVRLLENRRRQLS
jgi:hypothetical protein